MNHLKKLGIAGAFGAALALIPVVGGSSASAAPNMATIGKGAVATDSAVVEVRRRGRGNYGGGGYGGGKKFYRGGHQGKFNRGFRFRNKHRRFRNFYGPSILFGVGPYAYYNYYDDDYYDNGYYGYAPYSARERCARRFRSFEWDTGLYTTYSGHKRLCPYLRY